MFCVKLIVKKKAEEEGTTKQQHEEERTLGRCTRESLIKSFSLSASQRTHTFSCFLTRPIYIAVASQQIIE